MVIENERLDYFCDFLFKNKHFLMCHSNECLTLSNLSDYKMTYPSNEVASHISLLYLILAFPASFMSVLVPHWAVLKSLVCPKQIVPALITQQNTADCPQNTATKGYRTLYIIYTSEDIETPLLCPRRRRIHHGAFTWCRCRTKSEGSPAPRNCPLLADSGSERTTPGSRGTPGPPAPGTETST